MEKQVIFIRMNYALHNNLFWKLGKKAYSDYYDTHLLNKGIYKPINVEKYSLKEAAITKKPARHSFSFSTNENVTNCYCIFSNDIKMKALDCLMEYPQGGFEKCNKRKRKEMLETIYPSVDFQKYHQ